MLTNANQRYVNILIVCRLPDPHVDAVLAAIGTRCTVEIWDLNAPHRFTLSLACPIEALTTFRSVWWRYKATVAEYQGTQVSHEAFATREWLAALRALAAINHNAVWVNDPVSAYASTLKVHNLNIATLCGFKIPDTLVTNCPDDFNAFFSRHSGQIIYKPLTYYFEAPDIAIFTSRVPVNHIESFAKNIQAAPALLQEEVNKSYELRVTVVGEQVFAVKINSQSYPDASLDWRRDQMNDDLYEKYELSQRDRDRLLLLHNRLSLKYGAYDFIVDNHGELVFLEVNPGGQWLWIEQALRLNISEAIAEYLINPVPSIRQAS